MNVRFLFPINDHELLLQVCVWLLLFTQQKILAKSLKIYTEVAGL